MLLPSALAVGDVTPSNLRAVGLLPFVYAVPALALSALALAISRRRAKPLTTWLWVVPVLVLVIVGSATAVAYYRGWASSAALYYAADGDLVDVATYLNQAYASGDVRFGEFELEAGETIWTEGGAGGFYEGDPFDGYKHEEEIKAGDKLYVPLHDEGLRLTFDGQTFSAIPEYANHPMTLVTWFGANAFCENYDWHLPTEIEWEKAARGTEIVDGHGLPFPWGEEIHGNNANYYSSFDLFERMFGKLGNTTPTGFYNGQTYEIGEGSYETLDSPSPYGLYDMAGNVWQWMGDDYPDQHYRYMRGGSFYTYEVDLRVWKNNSAGPQYYSPALGFRCIQNQ